MTGASVVGIGGMSGNGGIGISSSGSIIFGIIFGGFGGKSGVSCFGCSFSLVLLQLEFLLQLVQHSPAVVTVVPFCLRECRHQQKYFVFLFDRFYWSYWRRYFNFHTWHNVVWIT